ncbi:MAG: Hsp20/alpha crystallin family protein [Patescibacteria group bacterium]|jgi:HSP20 family protein
MLSLFKKKNAPENKPTLQDENNWLPAAGYEEGQLSVDIYETDKTIVVRSTVAGVKPEDLDITLDHDMLTIRGSRGDESGEENKNYLYRECYWGSFSRSIILSAEVDDKNIDAAIENGVLTIILKKIKKDNKVGVKVKC